MTLTCTIDATGITAPDYPSVLAELTTEYRGIYGADAYLEPDSQDGALLAIFALAIHDTNSKTIAAYNNFSPATAQGEGLSRVVKINGIARAVPTYSAADVLIVGQVGTVIQNAVVLDPNGGRWLIDSVLTIPPTGQVTGRAVFDTPGAVVAPIGTLTTIGTPTLGWQTVSNPAAAVAGAAVESDAALRVRQTQSTALPSRSIIDGIAGAIETLSGVARLQGYENDTGTTDANGIPAHTISFVVDGGDPQIIADTIGAKKGPGTGTYGTTTATVVDVYSIPGTIKFYRPTLVPIKAAITMAALTGYTTAHGTAVKAALAAYITGLRIGAPVRLTRLYVPIDGVATTYNVTALTVGRVSGSLAAADVAIAFNEAATCVVADIALTVT